MTDRLLTEDAAAEEAGVDIETVRRWAARGLLVRKDNPAGEVRYARDTIRALLASAYQPPWRLPKPPPIPDGMEALF